MSCVIEGFVKLCIIQPLSYMLNKLVHEVGDIEKCAITVANLNSPAVNSRCGQCASRGCVV